MNRRVIEYDLPAPAAVLTEMTACGASLAALAGLESGQVIKHLRDQWAFPIGLRHLRALAYLILQRESLCLSLCDSEYWITFKGSQSELPVSISGSNEVPQSLLDQFPVTSVNGLEPFLRFFGGTAERVPPGNYFMRPQDFALVSGDDTRYDWGKVDDWTGSLKLYQGGGGDCIVVHSKGTVGTWSHEIAWEQPNETPFRRLHFGFVELILHYCQYVTLPLRSPKREDSPFFI